MNNNNISKKKLQENFHNILKDESKNTKSWWERWKYLLRTPGNVPPPPFYDSKDQNKKI